MNWLTGVPGLDASGSSSDGKGALGGEVWGEPPVPDSVGVTLSGLLWNGNRLAAQFLTWQPVIFRS